MKKILKLMNKYEKKYNVTASLIIYANGDVQLLSYNPLTCNTFKSIKELKKFLKSKL